jgi:hypothetical protein
MCDYSLHGIPSRLAKEDEVLVIHRFYTGSKGLTSPELLKPKGPAKRLGAVLFHMLGLPARREECAVCVPDGAKLMLHGISSQLQRVHGLSPAELITFRQLSMDEHIYRDAVEFRNGVRVRLQDLEDGQTIQVLALSSGNTDVAEEFIPTTLSAARMLKQSRNRSSLFSQ